MVKPKSVLRAFLYVLLLACCQKLFAFEIYAISETASSPGQTVQITLAARNVTNDPIVYVESLDFQLAFDSSLLQFVEASVSSNLLSTNPPPFSAFNVFNNQVVFGSIAIVQPLALSEGMPLVHLTFMVLPAVDQNSVAVDLAEVITNEEYEQITPGPDPTDAEVVVELPSDDLDGDGIPDSEDPDIDGDGLPNSTELSNGLDPYFSDDAQFDKDLDGLLNIEEFNIGTEISISDTDGDEDSDFDEVQAGTDPLDANEFLESTTIILKPGFNLIALPQRIEPSLARDWVSQLGGVNVVEKLQIYDRVTNTLVDIVEGSQITLTLGNSEAFIVYALSEHSINFSTRFCEEPNLLTGVNLRGFSCSDKSAFELLDTFGVSNVASIQHFSLESGQFETAAFRQDGSKVGVDFQLAAGEGYFVFAK